MTYKEKKKKEKKTSFLNSVQDTKEIIDDLKNNKEKNNSSSESKNGNGEEQKAKTKNLYNEERIEENIKKHIIIIQKNEEPTLDGLIPKNQSGKFLMDEKSDNKKEYQILVDEIMDNFKNKESVKSIIEKYIIDFKSDERREKFFKKQGYILTEKSMERMALLIHYILNGIPVLLEGNTGTSKNRTALTACNYIKKFMQKKGKITKGNL